MGGFQCTFNLPESAALFSYILIWLVVSSPLKNMKVNWDDELPNIWENQSHVPGKPPTSHCANSPQMGHGISQNVRSLGACDSHCHAGEEAEWTIKWTVLRDVLGMFRLGGSRDKADLLWG